MKIICGAALTLCLAGCQGTTFEKPPIAESACDPALVGHWSSIGDSPSDNGDVLLDVSASCRLEVIDHNQGAIRQGEPTQVHVGKLGSNRYFWVDAAWAQQRFESELTVHAGDVHVLRYRIEKGDLVLNTTDDKAIAARITAGEIPGETHDTGKGLQNRITGGPHPKLLDSKGFFSTETARFRHGDATPSP
jgi:hypothetical protein